MQAVVDAEVQIAVVCLRGGDSGVIQGTEVQAGAGCGIELAEDVAVQVGAVGRELHPSRQREVAAAKCQRFAGRHGYAGIPPVKSRCSAGRAVPACNRQVGIVVRAVIAVTGRIPAVAVELPVR